MDFFPTVKRLLDNNHNISILQLVRVEHRWSKLGWWEVVEIFRLLELTLRKNRLPYSIVIFAFSFILHALLIF